ncbi:MAG: STAS domain-containing protein [Pseudomonadota bacterium]
MIEQEIRGDCLVLTIKVERLDHYVASDFKADVLDRVAASHRALVLDLSDVKFMDSSGLGALMGIRKRLGWSVRIVLAGLKNPVFKVFELARVMSVFTFYTSVDAALGQNEGESRRWAKS